MEKNCLILPIFPYFSLFPPSKISLPPTMNTLLVAIISLQLHYDGLLVLLYYFLLSEHVVPQLLAYSQGMLVFTIFIAVKVLFIAIVFKVSDSFIKPQLFNKVLAQYKISLTRIIIFSNVF